MGPIIDPESSPDAPERAGTPREDAFVTEPSDRAGAEGEVFDASVLTELVGQLDRDAAEWSGAARGLDSLDPAIRVELIQRLGRLPRGPGVEGLLRLLADSAEAETRAAAEQALGASRELAVAGIGAGPRVALSIPGEHEGPRIVAGLLTGVDGEGRATIGLSATLEGERRSALFRCDVAAGITDAVGSVEPEGSDAGRLLDALREAATGVIIEGAPELAVRLLAGCLWQGGPGVHLEVRHWLEATVGAGFPPHPYLIVSGGPDERAAPEPAGDEPQWSALRILDECPDWLDRSPLTFDLAEEIILREGRVAADPTRDAGAIRYLFEHRILGRLELYRRMLFWMARCWEAGGRDDLASSADRFAIQLSDEQFAVPGHPFARALATRSLDAAGEVLGTAADPRSPLGDR